MVSVVVETSELCGPQPFHQPVGLGSSIVTGPSSRIWRLVLRCHQGGPQPPMVIPPMSRVVVPLSSPPSSPSSVVVT